jgi:hypothetical protein
VGREEAVIGAGIDQLGAGLCELGPDQHRQQAADEEEEEGGDDVLDPDHLVIGVEGQVVAPARGTVIGVVLGPGGSPQRPAEPVADRAEADQEPKRGRERGNHDVRIAGLIGLERIESGNRPQGDNQAESEAAPHERPCDGPAPTGDKLSSRDSEVEISPVCVGDRLVESVRGCLCGHLLLGFPWVSQGKLSVAPGFWTNSPAHGDCQSALEFQGGWRLSNAAAEGALRCSPAGRDSSQGLNLEGRQGSAQGALQGARTVAGVQRSATILEQDRRHGQALESKGAMASQPVGELEQKRAIGLDLAAPEGCMHRLGRPLGDRKQSVDRPDELISLLGISELPGPQGQLFALSWVRSLGKRCVQLDRLPPDPQPEPWAGAVGRRAWRHRVGLDISGGHDQFLSLNSTCPRLLA